MEPPGPARSGAETWRELFSMAKASRASRLGLSRGGTSAISPTAIHTSLKPNPESHAMSN